MHKTDACLQRPATINPSSGGWLQRITSRLRAWDNVARERHELLALDARALRDIGIGREDAQREAQRPFWDLPERR
jgi:uncharacterized protein YjiS (DUF1127 family)